MINKEELRIGNLVLSNGKVWRVSAIDDGCVTVENTQRPYNKLVTINDEVFPILLTNVTIGACADFGLDSRYKVTKVFGRFDFFDDALTVRSLKRVQTWHEVQNLFYALTGRELQVLAVIKTLMKVKKADSG